MNRVKAALKNKNKALAQVEGVAEFNSQMKLLGQSMINYLDVCDAPDKCEAYLTKLTVQLEELEGKFSEFDEFIEQLAAQREEIYNAFENKRLQLVEARNKKASSLFAAAERILKVIFSRVTKFTDINEIHGYFAGDLMVEKIRNITEELVALDDSVKADDLRGRLKTIGEDAVRQLKDKTDLFEEGGNLIKLGKHKFSVNVQNLALTTVLREDRQYFHLTGTNFFEEISDPDFLQTRNVWHMTVPSENRQVYRAEFLAFQMLKHLSEGGDLDLQGAAAMDQEQLLGEVQRFMGPRYQEGYAKGVHDRDACLMLNALIGFKLKLGLLAFSPQARACAAVFWRHFLPAESKAALTATCEGLRTLNQLFPANRQSRLQRAELQNRFQAFLDETELFEPNLAEEASHFLFQQRIQGGPFPISLEAGEAYRRFVHYLKHRHYYEKFNQSVTKLEGDPIAAFILIGEWVTAFLESESTHDTLFSSEVAALLFCEGYQSGAVADLSVAVTLEGLKGSHPLIEKGRYDLNYHDFTAKMNQFEREVTPRYQAYIEKKKALVQHFEAELRLEEFKPHILTSFVRNKLLDQVYLPLIGDNLAKQIGAAGDQTRTDRMGMLLLISPPGYGKTTLMEYIANRVGLIFMKINGPAIGHEVTSLDPSAAPHSAARGELHKLNLALEMGDNVMIYLDDIQHCNPELLQKFISLCDAQRKIEGVYKGKTRTYDLRGKKVAVVMAGNPYTESGEKFRIPDMLANRADTYNLGDIIGSNGDAFEMSYVENCLTSNPVLSKLASKSQKDVYTLMDLAVTGNREGIQLEGNYSSSEIEEFTKVFKKIFRVRDVILAVNQAYIRSAAQEDAYRTEPPFKLQGSYRNMNKIAEKILPIMNDEELETTLLNHYENEAQTLTSGAEANLLKFRQLTGQMTGAEQQRWQEITKAFAKQQQFHGIDTGDKVGQVVAQLSTFGEGLNSIEAALSEAVQAQGKRKPRETMRTHTTLAPETLEAVTGLLAPLLQSAAKAPEPVVVQDTSPGGTGLDSKHLLKVIRQQFSVMQHWLKPTYDVAKKQDQHFQDMAKTMETLLKTHGQIIRKLERQDRPQAKPPVRKK